MGHWEYDVAENQFTFTDELFNVLGTTAEEMGGYKMSPERYTDLFVHPDDLQIVGVEIQKAIEATDPNYSSLIEHRIFYADGSTGHIAVSIHIIKDEDGNTIKTFGVNQDITERKRMENELIKSEEILNRTGKMAKVGGWELDIKTLKFIWTEETYRIHEIPLGQLPTLEEATNYYHPEDRPKMKAVIQRAIEHNEPWEGEFRLITANGKQLWTRSNGNAIIADGKIVKIFGTIQDISEQKQAEKALHESELRFRTIYENAPVFIDALDENGRFVLWNKECREIFGWTLEEINEHEDTLALFYPDPDVRAEALKTVTTVQDESFREWHPITRDGKTLVTMWANFRFPDGIAFNLGYDITEQKKQEHKIQLQNEQLQKSNQELDQFVYSVSHNLRAPITSSLGLIKVIKQEKDQNQIDYFLDLQEQSLEKLDIHIKDILQYSINSRSELNHDKIDFKDLITDVLRNLEFYPGNSKIEKILKIEKSTAFYSDERRLKIILNNLISNSIKYQNKRGENQFIKISNSFDSSNNIILEIEDNGVGIPGKYHKNIFDMFFRATAESAGSGLGLYIVKETIAKLNGKISIDSVVGRGSKFTIAIPNVKKGVSSDL